jgi:uncharacterized protein YqeY
MIRDDIKAALIGAMKGGDKAATTSAFRSAIKNRDVDCTSSQTPDDDVGDRSALKNDQARRRSVELYRKETARTVRSRKRDCVIERFLRQLSEEEASAAIQSIIADTGASSMKDMGRVMTEVKARLGTQIEPARASALVKAALAG